MAEKEKEQEVIEQEQQLSQEENNLTLVSDNERLQQEVINLTKEIEAIKEQQKKLMLATKVNTLKEQEIRNEEYKKYAKQKLIEDSILPVLLNFERALNFKTDDKNVKNFLVGFEFIFNELKNTLEKEGLKTINIKIGEVFDSYLCEAVETEIINKETKDQKDNIIVKVVANGYKLYDRVVCPTKVKIIKVKDKEKIEKENKGEI